MTIYYHMIIHLLNIIKNICYYNKGFIVIIEPFENDSDTIPNPIIHLW